MKDFSTLVGLGFIYGCTASGETRSFSLHYEQNRDIPGDCLQQACNLFKNYFASSSCHVASSSL